jgi:hypothetical protein
MKLNFLNFIFRNLLLAGNDAAPTMQLANAADGGSPFAILQSDGFLIPYGEFPHKVGLQIFDRAAADAMVANHGGMLNRLASWARGQAASYPVYVGHPDLPGSKDTDKRAYGWIEGMVAENDGLRLTVKWSDAGRELVENAHFKFYSPLWWTKPVKRGVVRPVSLKSMGLTNDPNIPVPALANEAQEHGDPSMETQAEGSEENESQQTNDDMKELLLALGLEEGATMEDALAKIAELKKPAENTDPDALKKAEDAKAYAEAEKVKAEEEKVAAENSLTDANKKIVSLEAFLTAAANNAVDAAVTAGKITMAEREAKVSELLAANDFATALQDLGKMTAKVKTTSATGDLGGAKTRMVVAANDASKAAREERAQLVENEFQNTNASLSLGQRKRIAWERAQKKNPEAFGKKESSGSAA